MKLPLTMKLGKSELKSGADKTQMGQITVIKDVLINSAARLL